MQKNNKISFCVYEDDFDLKKIFPNLSNQKIKKYLKDKKKSFDLYKKGDEIELPINLVNDGEINPIYTSKVPEIFFNDEHFIAFDKPHFIHSHPLTYNENDNLLSFIRNSKYFKILSVNSENYDRGLLYRLDYVTSGVLIYCKDNDLYKKIRSNFDHFAHTKKYFALVDGKFVKDQNIKQWFLHKGEKKSIVKVFESETKNSFCGEMNVKIKKYDKDTNKTLLEVELKTGLRHQIRAGLAGLGFPIVGDHIYGGSESDFVHLHAHEYSLILTNLLNKDYIFRTSLPKWCDHDQK